MSRMIDETGKRYGRLIVIEPVKSSKSGQYWRCKCDCGQETIVWGTGLRTGDTKSCGCYKLDLHTKRLTKHGKRWTRPYRIWLAMRNRCNNTKTPCYDRYGGRGITCCERWSEYENFIADMGEPPSKKHSLDRIDNEGNYTPENCRWATDTEQANNKRNSRMIEYDGKRMTVADWARYLKVPASALYGRIHNGWDDERVVSTPVKSAKGK